jgi:hypothetical protein
MFTWIYIIYFNLFIKTTNFFILYDSNDNEYAIINIYNILDSNLILELNDKMNSINYSNDDKYIGLNYLNVKDILLAIPLIHINITSNKIISFSSVENIKPYTININNNKKKLISDKVINFNSENLFMKNIFNYENNNIIIPFYLIINR